MANDCSMIPKQRAIPGGEKSFKRILMIWHLDSKLPQRSMCDNFISKYNIKDEAIVGIITNRNSLLLRRKHYFFNHPDYFYRWIILTEQLFNFSICCDCVIGPLGPTHKNIYLRGKTHSALSLALTNRIIATLLFLIKNCCYTNK